MGRVTPEHLYHILWAANAFSHNHDPAADINSYLIANQQWTANIREDSGQPDAWRDYQQILSELGLMYSLESLPAITPTPLGLAFLDGSMGFSEVMTLQALRFQYPNGHHVMIGATQRSELATTSYVNVDSFTQLQALSNVMIRPTVLVWRVLRRLADLGTVPKLDVNEFESYLMRCSRNEDFAACADSISAARRKNIMFERLGSRQRRNAQDWMRFLRLTSIFSVTDGRPPSLTLSDFGNLHAAELDELCAVLEAPSTFWQPGSASAVDRLRWYSQFGGVDLSIPELPTATTTQDKGEFVGGKEEDDHVESEESLSGGHINLREFQGVQHHREAPNGLTIQSVYRAELSKSAHRLHDRMVLLIAETCRLKGAVVFEDPSSVDLLVQYNRQEFIVEVKSVTAKNFVGRLRCALGQVLHYDYLRSPASNLPRRKVIALAAHIPDNSWSITFVNSYLKMDLLALTSDQLQIHSSSKSCVQLFG